MCGSDQTFVVKEWPDFSTASSPSDRVLIPGNRVMDRQEKGSKKTERIKLWDIKEHVHCSIVGTCATVDDIKHIAKKVGINLRPEAADYVIHGHLVTKTTEDTPFARAFQKLLDSRFQGAIRKVKRITEPDKLKELWCYMRDNGQIAGAHWAFLTFTHVPMDLKELIYGEVHMLSHLQGANFRQKAEQAGQLEGKVRELEDRLRRNERSSRQAVSARDGKIEQLRAQRDEAIVRCESQTKRQPPPESSSRNEKRIAKIERALISARTRARQAERDNQNLSQQLAANLKGKPVSAYQPTSITADQETSFDRDEHDLLKILYVGGRSSQIPHLRSAAEHRAAILYHHDGGLEDALHRIDPVLSSVDCVMCPVDCISHSACLRAKRMCVKQNIPFLPLRTSSQTSFKTALEQFRTERQ